MRITKRSTLVIIGIFFAIWLATSASPVAIYPAASQEQGADEAQGVDEIVQSGIVEPAGSKGQTRQFQSHPPLLVVCQSTLRIQAAPLPDTGALEGGIGPIIFCSGEDDASSGCMNTVLD